MTELRTAPATATEDRFDRQAHVFGNQSRMQTNIAVLGCENNMAVARLILAGAAGMGIPAVAADAFGSIDASHWFDGPLDEMVETIHPDTRFQSLAFDFGSTSLSDMLGAGNSWLIVIPDEGRVVSTLMGMAPRFHSNPGVLVVTANHIGCVVHTPGRFWDALLTLSHSRVSSPGSDPVPWDEALIAAGLALNHVMAAPSLQLLQQPPGLVGFHAANPGSGTTRTSGVSFGDLLAYLHPAGNAHENATPLRGCRILMVGAGGLANFAWLPPVTQGATLTIVDDDITETSNLNRQLFLVEGVGQPKAEVLAAQINAYTGTPCCHGIVERITTDEELRARLDGHAAIICAADNDATRLLCSRVARRAGIPAIIAGTSAWGGQVATVTRETACYHCMTGAKEDTTSHHCWLTEEDQVVAPNMLAGGLIGHALRLSLHDRRVQHARIVGDALQGNRLRPMAVPSPCACDKQEES